jgi:hypothetical protein
MKPGTLTAPSAILLGLCWLAPVAAQAPVDFSGNWILDRAASVLQAESAAVESGTLRIEHRDPSFRFARTFTVKQKPMETAFDIATDGKEVTRAVAGRTSRSRLEWQGRSLLLTVLIDTPRGEVSNIVRYELLDGGAVLRAVEDLGGAAPVHHNVWMFVRRDNR